MWYIRLVADQHIEGARPLGGKRVTVVFFRTQAGGEPVRQWPKSLPLDEDRKRIGADIKTVEFGWPLGMNRIARVLFYVDGKQRMVLLHGFIKKTQKTPDEDLELARRNKRNYQQGDR